MRSILSFALVGLLPGLALAQGGAIPGPGPGTPHGAAGPATSPFALMASVASTPSVSTSTTAAINTTGANLCVVAPSWAYSSATISCAGNISDNKGNTWLTAAPGNTNVTAIAASAICYASPCTTGTGHTFTFTRTGQDLYGSFEVAAFKGAGVIKPTANYETAQADSNGASVTTITAGPVASLSQFMLSVTSVSYAQTTPLTVAGPNATWTIAGQVASDGNSLGSGLAYAIQGNAAETNPTWTASTAAKMAAAQAVFISSQTPVAPGSATPPCDLLAGGCSEAWSLTRIMRAAYSGPLFKIARISDRAMLDVGTTGGVVDLTAAYTFCGGTLSNCYIVQMYSQVNPANILHYSVLGTGGDGARPDCTDPGSGRPPCAAPLVLAQTTGLPEIGTFVGPSPGHAGYQYLLGTNGSDGTSVGIASGAQARSLMMVGQHQPNINACCGTFGPTAHTLGVDGTSYLLAGGYGDPGPGLLECTGQSYCFALDCEGSNSGCLPPQGTYPPLYKVQLPTNAIMLIGKYDPAGGTHGFGINHLSVNSVNYFDNNNTTAFMATGTHFALGGGGDFTTPAPWRFWEGLITNAVQTQTDENNLMDNIKAFYKMATFP